VTYLQPISKLGHRLCQNNSIVFENCRVPEENAFALGDSDLGHQQGIYLVRTRRRDRSGRCRPLCL
jgi:alkylation response protein AidB-like acyl-CoA dehydrogenase